MYETLTFTQKTDNNFPAQGFVLAYPTGNLKPSRADEELTKKSVLNQLISGKY